MATVDYCVIAAYLIIVTGLGIYLRKLASRNLESYFLGGKKIPWWALAASGAVSNFDITGTMWMVTVLYLLGMKSWWHHWMWGVMLPAFGLAYVAKWVRRSNVITGAEWMLTRFGDDRGGRTARMAYALVAVVTCVSFIGYAFQGIGKFAQIYVETGWLVEMFPVTETLLTTYKAQTIAIAILAMSGIGDVTDPELVMPMVLQKYLPIGVKGLVIAGLLSAFMSTFSSTANSGASYVVRDIWQPLFKPNADEHHLVRYSYIATIGVILAGIVVGLYAESIRSIWGWIMMALGGAVIVPNVLRWHWWRINGWGYAAGTLGGIALALTVLFFPDMPMYVQFSVISIGSLVACLVASILTAPAGEETLRKFYRTVRPFGAWGPVRKTCELSAGELSDPAESPWRTVFNTAIACCGVTGLYLSPMYLIGHWYFQACMWLIVVLSASMVLYFTWYRYLPKEDFETAGDES